MYELIMANLGKLLKLDFVLIGLYVAAFNILLNGARASLALVKDKTETDVDNKIYDFLGKVLGYLIKFLDLIGYNPNKK
jgi:hypothetical protein